MKLNDKEVGRVAVATIRGWREMDVPDDIPVETWRYVLHMFAEGFEARIGHKALKEK